MPPSSSSATAALSLRLSQWLTFDELHCVRADLTAAALVLARELTDTGDRTDLNDAIAALGLDRAELEAELSADLAAGCE